MAVSNVAKSTEKLHYDFILQTYKNNFRKGNSYVHVDNLLVFCMKAKKYLSDKIPFAIGQLIEFT